MLSWNAAFFDLLAATFLATGLAFKSMQMPSPRPASTNAKWAWKSTTLRVPQLLQAARDAEEALSTQRQQNWPGLLAGGRNTARLDPLLFDRPFSDNSFVRPFQSFVRPFQSFKVFRQVCMTDDVLLVLDRLRAPSRAGIGRPAHQQFSEAAAAAQHQARGEFPLAPGQAPVNLWGCSDLRPEKSRCSST